MTALKPYLQYKPSGVEWLGDIPVGWATKRLRFIATLSPSKCELTDLDKAKTASFLPMESVSEDGVLTLDTEKPVSEVLSGYTYFRENDVIVAKITPCFENGKAAICTGLKNGIGFGSTEFHVLRPKHNVLSSFLFYIIHSEPFLKMGEIEMKGAAGQKRVPEDFISNLGVPYVSPTDQARIAEFLDVEGGKIDALIAKSEKMAALLDEKRQAVITHYVTKGTNPTALLKPSGIDWLGDIPAGWEAVKLRFLCKIGTGAKDTENYVEEGSYPFFVRSDTVERIDTYSYDGEAVLTAGDGVGVGKVFHYYNGKFDFHQRVYSFTAFRKIAGKYFYLTFANFFKYQMYLNSAKSTVDSVRLPFLQNFVFPVPALPEQAEIIKTIETKTAKIDALKEKIIKQIELLKERKTSLITAAVTGKIDVRDYKKQQEAA